MTKTERKPKIPKIPVPFACPLCGEEIRGEHACGGVRILVEKAGEPFRKGMPLASSGEVFMTRVGPCEP